jgi:hypothetical protein
MANIVLRYSPFLAPTTYLAPLTMKLHHVLRHVVHDMLEEFLHKWRCICGESSTLAMHAMCNLFSHPLTPVVRLEDSVPPCALIDHRYHASKAVHMNWENYWPPCTPWGIRHHHSPQGRACILCDRPVQCIVQAVLQVQGQYSFARSIIKVHWLFSI